MITPIAVIVILKPIQDALKMICCSYCKKNQVNNPSNEAELEFIN